MRINQRDIAWINVLLFLRRKWQGGQQEERQEVTVTGDNKKFMRDGSTRLQFQIALVDNMGRLRYKRWQCKMARENKSARNGGARQDGEIALEMVGQDDSTRWHGEAAV